MEHCQAEAQPDMALSKGRESRTLATSLLCLPRQYHKPVKGRGSFQTRLCLLDLFENSEQVTKWMARRFGHNCIQ